ncbi:hypothetical protein HALDL1_11740 [Halobacterium sp. DL1]|jgi:hypothetical protein|nr:hypothetical protein HALDL1_11740 [Halobacterium sp. DL1]
MTPSEGELRPETPGELDGVAAGEQALVALPGTKFKYEMLPERAFENLLVVSIGRSPTQIERALEQRGVPTRNVGVVPITGSSVNYEGPMWTSNRVSPMDFTGISIEFNRGFGHLKPGTGWVLVDSVSILLMYAEVNRVYRLLDSIVGTCRTRDVTGVYTVDGNAVTPETLNRFRGLFDEFVE